MSNEPDATEQKENKKEADEHLGGFFDGLLILLILAVVVAVAQAGLRAFEPTIQKLLTQQEEAKKWDF